MRAGGVAAALMLATMTPSAPALELRDLSVLESPDSTRVILDLDAAGSYQLQVLDNPSRVVLDLNGARRGASIRHTQPGGGLVQRVRTGDHPDGLRVVLDLAEASMPTHFTLDPTEEFGFRLIVDLPGIVAARHEPAGSSVALAAPMPGSPAPATPPVTLPPIDLAPTPAASAEEAAPKAGSPSASPPREAAPNAAKPIVIAIDAGHGGADPGAKGKSGLLEKDVALAISRMLARRVNERPGYKAVLIRDGDHFIPLRGRMNKARQAQADLFVSIHCNAAPNRHAQGSAVYVLSQRGASNEHARWLANKENAADLIGGVEISDKDDTLAAVLFDISQSSAMEASIDVGGRVLGGLSKVNNLLRPDVQQAGFAVLKSPDIPSILVETAFISNAQEEKLLASKDYQEKLAASILEGIEGYFDSYRPRGEVVAGGHTGELVDVSFRAAASPRQ